MLSIFKNCKLVVGTFQGVLPRRGKDLAELPQEVDASVLVAHGRIIAIGQNLIHDNATIIDCSGRILLPCWVDSHTHLVFADSREDEFVMKLKGKTYADIAAAGGGILNSSAKLQMASEEDLYNSAWQRMMELIALGTGAIEIKTGYGLNIAAELKMINVISKLKKDAPIPVKITLLVAHAVPNNYKERTDAYIADIAMPLIKAVGTVGLADYIDVFCETGFFTPQQMEAMLIEGKKYGLKPKVHVNQLNSIGGLQVAVKQSALSVDHLETMTANDVSTLAESNTIGTLLPTAAYFLRMPFQPARQLIDAGAAVALASDFNPGSSPSGNMNTVVSMACIGMRMVPEEAICAATFNAACALDLQNDLGSIAVGKKANFILTKPVKSLAYLPYAFGTNLIESVFINGEKFMY